MIKIYEPCKKPCQICNERDVVLLPYCRDQDGKEFFMHVCLECRDKIPYEVVPIKTYMDEGYYYCPNVPEGVNPVEINPDTFDPTILTRYGKKLLKDHLT